MATLAKGGRITVVLVEEEIMRLQKYWQKTPTLQESFLLEQVLSSAQLQQMDLFDRLQLEAVLSISQNAHTLAEAGRMLFSVSRLNNKTANDTDRLRKYLKRFDIHWKDLTIVK